MIIGLYNPTIPYAQNLLAQFRIIQVGYACLKLWCRLRPQLWRHPRPIRLPTLVTSSAQVQANSIPFFAFVFLLGRDMVSERE
jgi:hypothetical protein